MRPSNLTYVCLECRTTAKREHGMAPKCQHCGLPMRSVGKHYRVPKRRDNKGWAKVAVWLNELRWWHHGRWFKSRQASAGIAANTHGTIGRRGRKKRKYNRARQKKPGLPTLTRVRPLRSLSGSTRRNKQRREPSHSTSRGDTPARRDSFSLGWRSNASGTLIAVSKRLRLVTNVFGILNINGLVRTPITSTQTTNIEVGRI